MLRVLVIDHGVPTPDKDAGSVDAMALLQSLVSLGFQVSFIPLYRTDNQNSYSIALKNIGIDVVNNNSTNEISNWCLEKRGQIDLIIISRIHVAKACIDFVKSVFKDVKIIFNTVDLHHIREARQADISNDLNLKDRANLTKNDELLMMSKSDVTVVVSDFEKQYLMNESPNSKVFYLPLCREYPDNPQKFSERRDILFVGSFAHQPNIDGIIWFINQVWPYLKKSLPTIRLKIIGSGMPEELSQLSNIGIDGVGYVEDLSTYLNECKLSIAPLRFGAGMKGKVISSLAYGLPVVGTNISCEGLRGSDSGVVCSDDPYVYSQLIIHFYTNEDAWNTLAENALKYRLEFGRDNFIECLKKLIQTTFD